MKQLKVTFRMDGFHNDFGLIVTSEKDVDGILDSLNDGKPFVRIGDRIVDKGRIKYIEIK